MALSTPPKETFVPGASRKQRNVRTFALQMERDIRLDLNRARRLKELRGSTPQRVIAEALHVETRSVQHWERGLGISWPKLEALAAYYGVTTNWLLYGDERPEGARSQIDHIEAMLEELLALQLERELEPGGERVRRRGVGNGEADNASEH
jgi:transcriptional regulator with XRE-family HTH domain